MRLIDWRERFLAFVSEREGKPFEWGKNDCALFAADAVLAITGEDLAAKYRGKYRSANGLKLMRKDGYKDQVDFVKKNFPEVPAAFAQMGDLGICESEGELIICVSAGSFALAVSDFGLARLPIEKVLSFYKVG